MLTQGNILLMALPDKVGCKVIEDFQIASVILC